MILDTLKAAIKGARESREAGRREAVREAVAEYLDKLPERRANRAIQEVLSASDITDALLRRFVASCPPDKHIEVSFPTGGTIIVSGRSDERNGPGW